MGRSCDGKNRTMSAWEPSPENVPPFDSGLGGSAHADAAGSGAGSTLRLRLDFQTVLRRVTVFTLLGLEFYTWHVLKVKFPFTKRKKRILLLLSLSPRLGFSALLVGAVVAVLADLLVRYAVSPLVRRWFLPPVDLSSGSFYLASNERVQGAVAARCFGRRRWRAGVLALTNFRIWFFPHDWDHEPWSVPLGEVKRVFTTPAPALARGLLAGLPDRVVIETAAGTNETFVVADPAAVGAWCPPRLAQS
jgi:hypothetical protein